LPDLEGRDDADDSDSEGRAALRYSAGSNCDARNGVSAGSETCEDLEAVLPSDTAMV
jgi:hypothetical protein